MRSLLLRPLLACLVALALYTLVGPVLNFDVSLAAGPEYSRLKPRTAVPATPSATSTERTYASDTFSRQLAGTWGSASAGGAYSSKGVSFGVNGSAGTMNTGVNATKSIYLADVSALSIDVTFRLASAKPSMGGGQIAYFIGRSASFGNGYLARLRFPTDNRVWLQAGREVDATATMIGYEVPISTASHKAGGWIRVHIQMTGMNPTTVRMRAWDDGASEPTSWQYSMTDSTPGLQAAGGVGFRSYVSGAASNAPVLFYFDDLLVVDAGTAYPAKTTTPAATATITRTPTFTQTPLPTDAPTSTPTNSPTETNTPTPAATYTNTPTATESFTPTNTRMPTATNTFTPTATRTATPGIGPSVYWGAYVSGVPWNMPLQDAFEANTRKRVSIIHWGQPWIRNGVYQPFYAGDFDKVRARGAIPLLDWGSWDYALGVTQPDFQLADIYNGLHDAHIRNWATGAKNWGHPLFLRFDWEMNGWWQFPWSEQLNGNQPGDFVKAWRHVHDIFVGAGANNVTWVWCPNITSSRSTPLASMYPGDDYVDWVGMDGYNFGTNKGNAWQSFAQVFGPTYNQLIQVAPTKPIMIAETASSELGGSKAAWITDALATQLPINYPRIKAFVWFNWNDNDSTLDWPIESSQSSVDGFAAAIANPYYASNDYSNLDMGPIRPLP